MPTSITEKHYQDYLQSLLTGDSVRCKSIIHTLVDHGVLITEIYEHLIRRSLYQVGDLWAKDQISVAEEHIATAITENLMSSLQLKRPNNPSIKKRVFVSCITADLHQIGARMVANLFESYGWETFFLGANMPISDLINAVQRIQPHVICLSVTLVEHISTLEITLRELRSNYPQTPIIVGGAAFTRQDPSIHRLNQIPYLHIVQSILQLERLIVLYGQTD